MDTVIFNGKLAAAIIKQEIKNEAEKLGLTPGLAVILVGDDPASLTYVGRKQKICEEFGWSFNLVHLPKNSTFENLKFQISNLNNDPSTHGIVVQLPLPHHISSGPVISLVAREKEVDGLVPTSKFTPPTAQAVVYVLTSNNINIHHAQAVVFGRGKTAGAPIAKALHRRGAHVTVINSQTHPADAKRFTLNADIIVSAVGKPNLITGEMVKEGAAVISVGLSRIELAPSPSPLAPKSKVVGDINEPSLIGKASIITPTPGGIGPLTVVFLLKNLLAACIQQSRIPKLP